ncbi:riboflavin synthase [Anaerosporobacter sp.]|uniref:riboflavin synthase n=1 Tax=Anaerosporobacter sp. TaxID=1872529 RepID=UPI00286F873D|nr:riboflavin synthase [Anaerosporobacter sp.]
MFTGIVEELGVITQIQRGSYSSILTIQGNVIFEDMQIGDSIAVNGVCLTVVRHSKDTFTTDVMHETLNRSSLSALRIGIAVNLERAMKLGGRFGGHIVSGHIDGTGIIKAVEKDDNAVWYIIEASEEIVRYIVEKGSIAIDGISLTVASVSKHEFQVSVIPHTLAVTSLNQKKTGDIVNLENDVIGKYVEKLLGVESPTKKESAITIDFLMKHGF